MRTGPFHNNQGSWERERQTYICLKLKERVKAKNNSASTTLLHLVGYIVHCHICELNRLRFQWVGLSCDVKLQARWKNAVPPSIEDPSEQLNRKEWTEIASSYDAITCFIQCCNIVRFTATLVGQQCI